MAWGLVLGGGGVVGVAWEAGVVAGLRDGGVDPREASVIVGTSAGSIIGSLILSDTPYALPDVDPSTVSEVVAPDLAVMMEIFQTWGSASPMTVEVTRKVGELATRATTMSEAGYIELISSTLPDDWPDGDLRVTGVSVSTGERAVWTASSGVPLHRAVAASCSVPGIFPPVTIGDDRYTDGGVWSGSNADIVRGADLDAVVFVGPLVGDSGIGLVASRSVEAELADLRADGVVTTSIVPDPLIPGLALMDPSQAADYHDAGRRLGAATASTIAALTGAERLPAGER